MTISLCKKKSKRMYGSDKSIFLQITDLRNLSGNVKQEHVVPRKRDVVLKRSNVLRWLFKFVSIKTMSERKDVEQQEVNKCACVCVLEWKYKSVPFVTSYMTLSAICGCTTYFFHLWSVMILNKCFQYCLEFLLFTAYTHVLQQITQQQHLTFRLNKSKLFPSFSFTLFLLYCSR